LEDIEEVMAEIDEEQLQEYQRVFDQFDREKKGTVVAGQIGRMLNALEQDYDDKVLRKNLSRFDAEGNGKFKFEAFCACAHTVINTVDKDTLERELKEAFRLFDKEGNGYIPTATLRQLLLDIDDKLTDAELDQAINEIDADGSGKIEFEEFWELMAGEEKDD